MRKTPAFFTPWRTGAISLLGFALGLSFNALAQVVSDPSQAEKPASQDAGFFHSCRAAKNA